MKTIDAVKLLQAFADVHSNSDLTFANNKVPVTKIVYDENTNTVNLR